MSSRREQFGTSTENPVKRYYSWKSNDKSFGYYDKESGENKLVFPLKVAYITERATVRGWHGDTDSAIWANEVKNTGKEPLNVYSTKADKKGNTLLASGLYKDIKANLQGGHYEKAIYAYEDGVGVVKINLKGSGLMAYSTFSNEVKKGLFDKFIIVEDFESGKKGSVKFTTPNFKLGEEISKDFDAIIDQAYNSVVDFLDYKKEAGSASDEFVEEETPEPVEADGLPF